MTQQVDADFADFVRARQRTLVRAAYLVCGDHHLAEDVVQGALAKVARRWEQLREGNAEATCAPSFTEMRSQPGGRCATRRLTQ